MGGCTVYCDHLQDASSIVRWQGSILGICYLSNCMNAAIFLEIQNGILGDVWLQLVISPPWHFLVGVGRLEFPSGGHMGN